MKYLIITLSFLTYSSTCYSQLTAKIKLKEPIEGICDENNIYSLRSYQDKEQIEACPKMTKEKLSHQLNQSLPFLKTNSKHKGKGFVSVFINCKGDLLITKVYFYKGENEELKNQLNHFFNHIKKWTPGKYYNQVVDSEKSYSFKIKKGIITL